MMTVPSPRASSTRPDILLLAAPEIGPEHEELARRASDAAEVRACRVGPTAAADLSAAVSGRSPLVAAAPLALGAADPMLAELAGLLRWAKARWPDATFLMADPLGSARHAVGWASRAARAAAGDGGPEPALLVLAAGGDPPANAEACAIARLLSEERGGGLVEVAFVRDARPTIAEGLRRLDRLGAGRVVAVPLTPLDGPTHRSARAQVEAAGRPGVAIAGPLLTPGAAAAVVRRRFQDALERWTRAGDDGLSPAHSHGSAGDAAGGADDILPPRYRGGAAVSPSSMGSASLKYDAEGRVAWDRIWQGFCHLALAGGPPHRGKLLEPPTREETLARPDDAARVAAEVARGLSMVTRLPVVADAAPGWVGLACDDEEMAVWMLRAIVVENVSVRREGDRLFLPAGPDYRVEKEIKNVVTAVAKTHHYWTEHRAPRRPARGGNESR